MVHSLRLMLALTVVEECRCRVCLCVLHLLSSFRKSTFFNVLTKSAASAENFPFCTIDPNENEFLHNA